VLSTNNYSTWLLRLTWRRARGLNASRVLRWWLPQTLKTLGLILQLFQGSGAIRLHPSVDFFQDGSRIKIDPQPEYTTQPKARGLLHMECDFAIALPYNLDFKTDELDHLPASWQFKYYWRLLKQYSTTLKNYSKSSRLLELLLSNITCSGACRAYTPGTARKDEDGLL
jgi:hypothetical protein